MPSSKEQILHHPDSGVEDPRATDHGDAIVDKGRRSFLLTLGGGILGSVLSGATGCSVIPQAKNSGNAGMADKVSEDPVTEFMNRNAPKNLDSNIYYSAFGRGKTYRAASDDAMKRLTKFGYTWDENIAPKAEQQPSGEWFVVATGKRAVGDAHVRTNEQPAATPPTRTKPEIAPEKTIIKERHIRLNHMVYGTVHVWHPEYAQGDKLDIVVYVHGYNSTKTVDDYWDRINHLQEQFKESGRKALFIAPQAQANSKDRVRWKCYLRALVDYAAANANAKTTGDITVIAHSGGYVTAQSWIDEKDLNTVILLDGFWNNAKRMAEWAGRQGKKLILVSTKKTPGSITRHIKLLGDVKRYTSFNGVPDQLSEEDNGSNVTHIISDATHIEMPSKKSGIISRLLKLY